MKKLMFIPFAVASLVALAGPASAHTPTVKAACGQLSVDLFRYENGSTVTVTIDGDTTTDKFDGNWKRVFPLSKTAAHVWSVQVDNPTHNGYDATFRGELDVCEQPPTTTTVPVVQIDITVTMTRGWLSWDCDTRTAAVNFQNAGTKDDLVSVAGREVAVPANGNARVNLTRYGSGFFYGPVASLVDNAPVIVDVRDSTVDSTGVVSVPCTSSVVLSREPVLAFTGPGRVTVLSTVAAVLIFFGVMSLSLSHRTRKMS